LHFIFFSIRIAFHSKFYPMKTGIYNLVYLLLLFTSCSKSLPFEKESTYLVGTKGVQRIWKISTIEINGASQPLTTQQKVFEKKFLSTGEFEDSDANYGVWSFTSSTSIRESYSSFPSNIPLQQDYSILQLNNSTLSWAYKKNGDNVIVKFYATN
jgi:hypothetical protein